MSDLIGTIGAFARKSLLLSLKLLICSPYFALSILYSICIISTILIPLAVMGYVGVIAFFAPEDFYPSIFGLIMVYTICGLIELVLMGITALWITYVLVLIRECWQEVVKFWRD